MLVQRVKPRRDPSYFKYFMILAVDAWYFVRLLLHFDFSLLTLLAEPKDPDDKGT